MSKIDLVGITEYAKYKGVNRSSVWRWIKCGKLNYYALSGQNRKMLAIEKNVLDSLDDYVPLDCNYRGLDDVDLQRLNEDVKRFE